MREDRKRRYASRVSVGTSLSSLLPAERVLTRPIDRAAYACDASFYTLTPAAVVRPIDTSEIRALHDWSRRNRIPLTFRAAGTSLSGQAVTRGVVVDVSRHWKRLAIEDGGRRVRVGPGVVGGFVNAHLARYGAKLGPDPASIESCMIGGIVANNSSGMCCGTELNAYRTLESLRFVLPSGTEIDTAAPDADAALAAAEPALVAGLTSLRDRVRSDAALVARIRSKYRIKNTMGYALNAFLDFGAPLAILWHLLVGSEGTLAFIAEAVFRTIPDLPRKSTSLLLFPDVPAACEAIAPLRDSGAKALELMDRASLRSVEGHPGVPPAVDALPPLAAAILAEYQAASGDELADAESAFAREATRLPLTSPAVFTRDPRLQSQLWAARKGLTATIGAMRPPGTSLIFEDVAFPHAHLSPGVTDLQALLAAHGYADGIVFGHAKDGNIHFILSQSFNDAASIARYERFTDELVALVVDRYDGSLKAEHGTGRNMAPFLAREWGESAHEVMREIKRLVDPDGILSPGVLLNDDPRAHVSDLKSLPRVEDEVDRCIECGFCEARCPSRDLTLTPRQRIAVRREEARRRAAGDTAGLAALRDGYDYAVIDTCATDGMCATACPVGIDTGSLVKRLRADAHSAPARAAAAWAASAFSAVEAAARAALVLSPIRADLPRRAAALPRAASQDQAAAVYLPSCVTRVLGEPRGVGRARPLPQTIVEVAARAGLPLFIPADAAGTCCGMPFSSKGLERAYAIAANRAIERAWRWSDSGRLPVVVDASPCAWSLAHAREVVTSANRARRERMQILDAVVWAHETVLPRLVIRRTLPRVAVHPVCSSVRLGTAGALAAVAARCADDVILPIAAGCCGFAGDRGFTHPELTEAATRGEAAELAQAAPCNSYVSSSRTCEIGMSRATGRPFVSFWSLVDAATRE
jgi:D-lactate dehydrogenase